MVIHSGNWQTVINKLEMLYSYLQFYTVIQKLLYYKIFLKYIYIYIFIFIFGGIFCNIIIFYYFCFIVINVLRG